MKKIYLNPTIMVVDIETKKAILTTSYLERGEDWSSGTAAGREDSYDWEDE